MLKNMHLLSIRLAIINVYLYLYIYMRVTPKVMRNMKLH